MSEESRQTIVLGVTGGIGAYKSCEAVRILVRKGYRVKVAMTHAATRFVGPLTFRTLTGEPVAVSLWDDAPGDPVHHISLAKEADVFAVVPCTANVLAKMNSGRADDLLTTALLATEAPVVVAPAMNDRMWLDEATRANVQSLQVRGVVFVEPGTGELACGDEGVGRLAEVAEIVDAIEREARRVRSLDGVRILVTAGGTREPIDPVRFLGNRSSGITGFAIAEEAARRGAEVTVVAGATTAQPPWGCEVVGVETAAEMHAAVLERVVDMEVVVMTAAVADYRPERSADAKIKKTDGTRELRLERTADILADVIEFEGDRLVIGFAAETEDVVANAREKLARKGCDLIVANDVSVPGLGFGSPDNAVVLVEADSEVEIPATTKREIACVVVERIDRWIERRRA